MVSRSELIDHVWEEDAYPSTRTVDNQILALRKKIERDPKAPRYITSVRSLGYRFDHD